MEVIYLTHATELKDVEPHVMAIGFFDGVHLGHQALFKKTKKIAAELGVKSSALTFSPHPEEIIKGDVNKKYLTPLKEKIRKISECQLDKLYVMKFDKPFASLPPTNFIDKYIGGMNVKHVVVGFDFTFGFKAAGDVDLLCKLSKEKEYEVTVVPKITYQNEKISSTLIRNLLAEGNVELIPYILGNHYQIKATLQTLGTAEDAFTVTMLDPYMLPKHGTYEVNIYENGHVHDGELVHAIDGQMTLYAKDLKCRNVEQSIVFLSRLKVKETVLVSS